MLGMVNSNNRPAPMSTSDTNPEKGYISRSKMKISFNDDTRTINIETPSGNSLILSEDTRSIIMKDQLILIRRHQAFHQIQDNIVL